jgi:general secretion pathway protein K
MRAHTSVNANTAPAEVIAAAADIDLGDAQRLVQVRSASYFKSVADIQSHVGGVAGSSADLAYQLGVGSQFFEVHSRLRLDKLVVEEHAIVFRQGTNVTVLRRERGAADPTTLSRIAAAQR